MGNLQERRQIKCLVVELIGPFAHNVRKKSVNQSELKVEIEKVQLLGQFKVTTNSTPYLFIRMFAIELFRHCLLCFVIIVKKENL